MMKPVVAIIGRPNVGKSTLFNAIAKKNVAIIHDMPGVTRDRNYLDVTYDEHSFILIDTGGFDPGTEDDMGARVKDQAHMAVDEAGVILFLMDALDGLLPGDIDIARILQRSGKKVIYVVNKAEGKDARDSVHEFYELGADSLFSISAKHRVGLTELLIEMCSHIPMHEDKTLSHDEIIVSIIGRPNVGKSSLINKLVGSDRLLVSNIAGTTRDPVDSVITYKENKIRFIDTAGIRRKSKITYSLEKYCAYQSFKCISRSMLCILLLDASEGVSTQDAKLAAQICERNRGCIVVLNKWDTIQKDSKTHDVFMKKVRDELPFVDFAPVLTVSALTGLRARTILDVIVDVGKNYYERIETAVFNKALQQIVEHNPPPRGPRRTTKIYYAVQVTSAPPVFKLYTNSPKSIPQHYVRYLERKLRERFGFTGIPLNLQLAHRSNSGGKEKGSSR